MNSATNPAADPQRAARVEESMESYKVLGLGAKFGGRCVRCGQDTGSRSFELADTLLLKGASGYAVAHPLCVGVATKHAVGGGTKVRGSLPATIEA